MLNDKQNFTNIEPHIDYLAKDFATFRQLMLDHLSVLSPRWTENSPADLGHVLVEVLAYAADYLSYYQDAVATEAYLDSARLRRSVRRHARLLDYFLHEGCNARVWVQVVAKNDAQHVHLAQGTHLLTDMSGQSVIIDPLTYSELLVQSSLVFATMHDVELFGAHNAITVYAPNPRQEPTLPVGATSAWLEDADIPAASNHKEQLSLATRQLGNLHVGDVLIFDQVLDPLTGNEHRDPRYRHAVRLTNVSYNLTPEKENRANRDHPLVKIEWSEADALPIAFYIAPYGKNKKPVTIVRGNIVLADHGRRIRGDQLPPVLPGVRYRPPLRLPGLTHRVAYHHELARKDSARESIQQDPRHAMPDIRLLQQESMVQLSMNASLLPAAADVVNSVKMPQSGILRQWNLRRDLLNSDRFARDYLIEMEENGQPYLRFGFGDMGVLPESGDEFVVDYRVGNGTMGNVGPDTIHHMVIENDNADKSLSNSIERIWNPLAAESGSDPEQIEEVRLQAPYAFRRQKEQCITEEDYATMAMRYPGVLQASANIRYVGMWHTAFIYVRRDTFEPLSAEFRSRLNDFMQRYRQAGYEIDFRDPFFVALTVELAIYLKPGQRALIVQDAINQVLSNQINRDGSHGFFYPANFGLGQPVYRSNLISALMSIAGVLRVEVTRFGRSDGESNVAEIPMGPLEVAELQNDPAHPDRGSLSVKVIETSTYEQYPVAPNQR